MGSELPRLQLDPELDPWERQPGETPTQYRQYVTYRDLGPVRSVAAVAEQLGRHPAHLRAVAAANQWTHRTHAHDRHIEQQWQITQTQARRSSIDYRGRLTRVALGKFAEWLQARPGADLADADAIRLFDRVMTHAQALFGDPTATVQVTGAGGGPIEVRNFQDMPPEQRDAEIIALTDDVRGRLRAINGEEDD